MVIASSLLVPQPSSRYTATRNQIGDLGARVLLAKERQKRRDQRLCDRQDQAAEADVHVGAQQQ